MTAVAIGIVCVLVTVVIGWLLVLLDRAESALAYVDEDRVNAYKALADERRLSEARRLHIIDLLRSAIEGARRLLVIDPLDTKQVDALADAFCLARWDHMPGANECDPLTRQAMRDAVAAVLDPPPPEPVEPRGLGAVVEDGDGNLWTRVRRDDSAPWHCSTRSNWSRWTGIPRPLTVHSEGWTA